MRSIPVSAVTRGNAARWRLSLSSITALVRSDPSLRQKRALHLCYRAAGVPGAGYILIIPLASRSSSLNVKLSHCWILMSLEKTCCCWSPADALCSAQRAGTAHFSVHSSAHTHTYVSPDNTACCHFGGTAWQSHSFWHIDKQISICQC